MGILIWKTKVCIVKEYSLVQKSQEFKNMLFNKYI